MERVSVAVSTAEGIETREFNSGLKAGAVEKIIRERYGLRNGSLSQDQLTFTEDETLLAGNYAFDGFSRVAPPSKRAREPNGGEQVADVVAEGEKRSTYTVMDRDLVGHSSRVKGEMTQREDMLGFSFRMADPEIHC